jgi:predicted aspartyl protease
MKLSRANAAAIAAHIGLAAAILLVGGMPAIARDADPAEAAWEAWHEGRIVEAQNLALSVLSGAPADDRARHLIILTSFLTGDYERSVAQYERLSPDYEDYELMTGVVLEAYKHLDRLDAAALFARRSGRPDNECDWLKRRADNQIAVSLDSTTVIPFAEDNWLGDLMPAIPIELNGKPYLGHLDTGGSFIATSPKMVEELGIEVSQIGTGVANNKATTISVGLVGALKMGDATLTNVPVASLDALSGQVENLIILGTSILSRFLVTWDNGDGRLVLTPRGDDLARKAHMQTFAEDGTTVDFYLAGDHFMWARGAVGGQNVLFFVDTGLVTLDAKGRQPAIGAPAGVIAEWGGDVGDAYFVDSPGPVALGSASREDCSIHVFGDQRNLASFGGLQPGALISHGFLKHFVWTIDFDRRQYSLKEASREDPLD